MESALPLWKVEGEKAISLFLSSSRHFIHATPPATVAPAQYTAAIVYTLGSIKQ